MLIQTVNSSAESQLEVAASKADEVNLRSQSGNTCISIEHDRHTQVCIVRCSLKVSWWKDSTKLEYKLDCTLSYGEFDAAFGRDVNATKRNKFMRRTPTSDPGEDPAVFIMLPVARFTAFMITLTEEIWQALEPMLESMNPEAATA